MPKTAPKPDKPITFRSKLAMARALGINRSTVYRWTAKSSFPGGQRGPWKLADIIPWLLARPTRNSDDDPLLIGDSPALERYRAARAKLAELDVEERQARLLSQQHVMTVGAQWAARLSRASDHLGRRFGPEAQAVILEALTDCREILSKLGKPDEADTD